MNFKEAVSLIEKSSKVVVNKKTDEILYTLLQLLGYARNIVSLGEINDTCTASYIFTTNKEIKETSSIKIIDLDNYPYNVINYHNIIKREEDRIMVQLEETKNESNNNFQTKIKSIKIEDFTLRDAQQGINTVFIGLGQAGINITDKFITIKQYNGGDSPEYAYKGALVTSFAGDAQETERYKDGNKEDFIFLQGLEKGSGRDRELAKTALPSFQDFMRFKKQKEEDKYSLTPAQQKNLAEMYKRLPVYVDLKKTDMIIVDVGLGGGTGAGLLANTLSTVRAWLDSKKSEMVDDFDNSRTIVLGCTGIFPLKDAKELRNTRETIKELIDLANQRVVDFFIPIDNLHMSDRYKELLDSEVLKNGNTTFKKFINQIFVNWFHEINTIVTKSSVAAFDMKDLLTIFQPSRRDIEQKHVFGNISLNKHVLDVKDIKRTGSKSNLYTILEDVICNPTMTDKFEANTLYQMGAIIVKHPKNTKVTEDILLESTESLKKRFPNLDTFAGIKIGIIENEAYVKEEDVLIYTISKFLSYPARVNNLKNELKEVMPTNAAPMEIALDLGEDEDFMVTDKKDEEQTVEVSKPVQEEAAHEDFGMSDLEDQLLSILDEL